MKKLMSFAVVFVLLMAVMPAAAQDTTTVQYPAEGLSVGVLLLGLAGLALVGGILITRERDGHGG